MFMAEIRRRLEMQFQGFEDQYAEIHLKYTAELELALLKYSHFISKGIPVEMQK